MSQTFSGRISRQLRRISLGSNAAKANNNTTNKNNQNNYPNNNNKRNNNTPFMPNNNKFPKANNNQVGQQRNNNYNQNTNTSNNNNYNNNKTNINNNSNKICLSALAVTLGVTGAKDCTYGPTNCNSKHLNKSDIIQNKVAARKEIQDRYPGNQPHTFRDNMLQKL